MVTFLAALGTLAGVPPRRQTSTSQKHDDSCWRPPRSVSVYTEGPKLLADGPPSIPPGGSCRPGNKPGSTPGR